MMPAPLDAAKRAMALVDAGDYSQAIDVYDQALIDSPNDVELLQGKAYAYMAVGNFDDAGGAYDRAIEVSGDIPELWRSRGVAFEQQGKNQEALACYTKALELSPDTPQYLSDRADMLLATGNADDAIKSYRRADALQAPAAGDWIIRGNRFYEIDRAKDADDCFGEALKLDPVSVDAWWGKGFARLETDGMASAIACWDKAADAATSPEQKSLIVTYKGNQLARRKEYLDQAQETYDKAIAIDPRNEEALLAKGILLENMGKSAEAVDTYDRLCKLNPARDDAWEGKGRCLTHFPDRFNDALACYDAAIKLAPDSFAAQSDRGWVLIQLRKFTEAIDACEKARRLKPDESGPWVNAASTLMELGRFDECERLLKDGVKVVSEPNTLLVTLNLLYSDYLFDERKGLDIVLELLKTDSDPMLRVSVAENLLRIGDYSQARDMALVVEEGEAPTPLKNIAAFLRLMSFALQKDVAASNEHMDKFLRILADKDREPILETTYYFRGLKTRLLHSAADSMTKFSLMALMDLLTGKVDWTSLSMAASVISPVATVPDGQIGAVLAQDASSSTGVQMQQRG
jgi:tetratricopeptide (TPR) repeat protein